MTKWLVFILLVILFGCMPDTELGKVKLVNSQINSQITQKPDRDDQWQTLQETMRKRTGDCEDFAIAKYTKLIEMGVPQDKLKFALGYYKGGGHAFTLYYDESDPLVLDNLTDSVKRLSQRPDLTVFYTIGLEELNTEIKRRK